MSEWSLSADGWLQGARQILSPNCDERPVDTPPELLVVHAISLPPDQFGGPGVEQLFTNTLNPLEHEYYAQIHHLRVSAHFFIRRDGELVQFVSTKKRAWHAGVSCWRGRACCNDFSIGIELEGCDTQPFEDLQYLSLQKLIVSLAASIPLCAIQGHSDIAPGRKTDPGPFFNWSALYPALHVTGLNPPEV